MIRLARPWIGDEEIAAAGRVLASGMLVQGEQVAAFERALAARCARAHAVATSSGTTALELALAALGVRGGEVLCPDLSWPSPAHAIVRAGALPRLVDVDARSWNASGSELAAARTPDVVAAIVIDQLGTPADHAAIARALGDLPVIADAACSLGATIAGAPSASHGRIACLSFHPRKLITTGEGGACLTDDGALADTLRMLRNHGQRAPGEFVMPAGNQRMTEMAAAMGLAQLARLDTMIARRRRLAERYRSALAPGFATQEPPKGGAGNWQTFGVILPRTVSLEARDALVERMRAREVEAARLSYAIHRVASLEGRWTGGPSFPVSEHIEDRGLALPMHPLLSDQEQDRVLAAFDGAARELEIAP